MRRNYNAKLTHWLDGFMTAFLKAAAKSEVKGLGRDLEPFGLLGTSVMQEVLGDHWAVGDHGGVLAPAFLIAGNLIAPRKTVRRVLLAFARAGVIKAIVSFDHLRSRNRPLEIIVNPDFRAAAASFAPQKVREQLAAVYFETWLDRIGEEGDVQGFGDTPVRWGEAEASDARTSTESAPAEGGGNVITDFKRKLEEAKRGERLDDKQRKERDRKRRREEADAFVAGCAVVWRQMRSRHGHGDDPAPWSAKMADLPIAQQRERRELERVLGLYGGRKAALAWTLFCGSRPTFDEKGQRVFDPTAAHVQYVSPDKKPSAFTKHIALVFDDIRRFNYGSKPEMIERLKQVFGQAYEAEPRNPLAVASYNSTPEQTKSGAAAHGDQAAAGTTPG